MNNIDTLISVFRLNIPNLYNLSLYNSKSKLSFILLLSFFSFSHFCSLPAISDQYEYSGQQDNSVNNEGIDSASENSELNPQVNAYIDRGIRFHKRHEYAAAINEYNKAIALEPGSADLYFDRGLSLSESGSYYEAMNDFTKCINLNSSSDPCYFNRGIVEFELRDYPRALKDFNRTIQLVPGDAKALYNRAMTKYYLGNTSGALKDARESQKLWKSMHQMKDYREVSDFINMINSSNYSQNYDGDYSQNYFYGR